jgi:uncharacterized membrane protein YphA (DoxX/SURF4 family)
MSSCLQEVSMSVASWIVQVILAAVFSYSGVYKGTHSKTDVIASGQTGVRWYSPGFIRFIAISELFGVAGLILPRLLGVAPVLTRVAAIGLGIVMIGAAVSHARLAPQRPREWLNVATNVVLLAGCSFVAFARWS